VSKLLKAKPIVRILKKQLSSDISEMKERPYLVVFLVGEHPPSLIYTQKKKIFCEEVGARCDIIHLPANIEQHAFNAKLSAFAKDSNVHGILVQLPLPKQLDPNAINEIIPYEKDVDGFHPQNIFRLFNGSKDFYHISCTPWGILKLLESYNISVPGKNVCIIGRSSIVGKPLALLLTQHNATVTLCHSQTQNIQKHSQIADIIIVAVGKKHFLDKTYLNSDKKQIIIDVGINQCATNGLTGDVAPECIDECLQITPVPGGVGPMTIAGVVHNLIRAALHQKGL
jgi:methylenetetrahydrofolate dehydrogenase (NADP+) / methenyltetrahydrofolate cyclohydrolase